MRSPHEDGFALVEAIAALALSAIAAAGLIAALGSAAMRSAEADVRARALQQAQLVLTQVLTTPDTASIPLKGQAGESAISWTVHLGTPGDPQDGMQRVGVEVRWRTVAKEGATRLEVYRAVPT